MIKLYAYSTDFTYELQYESLSLNDEWINNE